MHIQRSYNTTSDTAINYNYFRGFLLPHGAGLPIPSLFFPLATSSDPLPANSPPAPAEGPTRSGGRSAGKPSPAIISKLLLPPLINESNDVSSFISSFVLNVNGIVGGICLLADFTGGGGGFFWGAIGNAAGGLERPEFIRAEVKLVVYGEEVEADNESDGRAYSSTSDAQYSVARAALVTSRRAKRLIFSPHEERSGGSQVLSGGAARTLNGVKSETWTAVSIRKGNITYCFMIMSFVRSSSGIGRHSMADMCFLTTVSTLGWSVANKACR